MKVLKELTFSWLQYGRYGKTRSLSFASLFWLNRVTEVSYCLKSSLLCGIQAVNKVEWKVQIKSECWTHLICIFHCSCYSEHISILLCFWHWVEYGSCSLIELAQFQVDMAVLAVSSLAWAIKAQWLVTYLFLSSPALFCWKLTAEVKKHHLHWDSSPAATGSFSPWPFMVLKPACFVCHWLERKPAP